ncbi:MAG: hypothetical protein GQ538_09385 [Xanthomonadales bacterium]|nr:hypothetical protein [Xanthomonadales bacterium]
MWTNNKSVKFQKPFLTACLLVSALFVSACSGLNRSDKPATKTWWLVPYNGSMVATTTVPPVNVAVSVTVVPGLDTHRILALSDNAHLSKYAGARWADSLPELVTSLVSRSLEGSGRFEVVSSRSDSGECDLEIEVQEFYARLGANKQTTGVRVAMDGFYRCDGTEPVPIRLNASAAVHDDRMTVIVAVFQGALDEVMKSLLEAI